MTGHLVPGPAQTRFALNRVQPELSDSHQLALEGRQIRLRRAEFTAARPEGEGHLLLPRGELAEAAEDRAVSLLGGGEQTGPQGDEGKVNMELTTDAKLCAERAREWRQGI